MDKIANHDIGESEVIAAVETLKSFDVPGKEPILEALEIKIRDMYATEETATEAETETVTSV